MTHTAPKYIVRITNQDSKEECNIGCDTEKDANTTVRVAVAVLTVADAIDCCVDNIDNSYIRH